MLLRIQLTKKSALFNIHRVNSRPFHFVKIISKHVETIRPIIKLKNNDKIQILIKKKNKQQY